MISNGAREATMENVCMFSVDMATKNMHLGSKRSITSM